MKLATPLLGLFLGLLAAGCNDSTKPATPPAAPRGLYSVTGDHSVTLHWLANTEGNVTGYRIYKATCADGNSCPYDRVGTVSGVTTTSFTVTGLTNGQMRFFAVAAYNTQNRESDLSYDTVYDTPRPEGIDAVINNYRGNPRHVAGSGWEFATATARAANDTLSDMIYDDTLGTALMYAFDVNTDIQDAGFGATLDHVDYAPPAPPDGGWSPSGSVELIQWHCYIVRTHDINFNVHYAKFQVTSLSASGVQFDWAYQTARDDRELGAQRAGPGALSALRAAVAQK